MAASSYKETGASVNYAALSRIYVEVYRDVLWEILIKEVPVHDLPKKLSSYLQSVPVHRYKPVHHQLDRLCRLPVISKSDCDISVLYSILKNVRTSLSNPTQGWGNPPTDADIDVMDDLERIRERRNSFYGHSSAASISDIDFQTELKNSRKIVDRLDKHLNSNFVKDGLDVIESDCKRDQQTLQEYQKYVNEVEEQTKLEAENKEKIKSLEVDVSAMNVKTEKHKTRIEHLDTKVTEQSKKTKQLEAATIQDRQRTEQLEAGVTQDRQRTEQLEAGVIQDRQRTEQLESTLAWHSDQISSLGSRLRQGEERGSSSEAAALPLEIRRMDSDSINLYKKVLEEGQEAVYNIRIMVIGHLGVGKTTLVHRLLNEDVDMNRRESTNGIEVHVRRCKVSLENQEWRVIPKDDTEEWISQRLALSLRRHRPTSSNREEKEEVDGFDKDEKSHAEVTGARTGLKEQAPIESPQSSSDIPEIPNISKQSNAKVAGAEQEDDRCIAEELKVLVAELEGKGGLHEFPNHADVSFWDFAGQYVFYTTHQIFLSSKAVYVLVTDMSKHIEDIVEEEEDCNFDTTGKRRISDFVDFWLNSVHSFSAHSTDSVPPVILVGTHADKLRKSDVSESRKYFEALRFHLADKETRHHLIGSDIDIDNTVTDPNLDTLRRTIFEVASKQSYWGEAMPVRWLSLERCLKKLQEKVVSFSAIEALNKAMAVPIPSVKELELFLRFHHEAGNIIYFAEEGLREYVVLDSQWMVDALKSIITAKALLLRTPNVTQHWRDLSKLGILRNELLDAVWTEQKHPSFHDNKDHLLTLMEKLNIISKPESSMSPEENSKTEQYYFMPCMLRNQPPQELLEPSTEFPSTPVLVFFSSNTYIPPAVFHRLLSACLSKWPIRRKGDQHLMFCGCGVFSINQANTIHVVFREYTIQTWVTKIAKKERDIDIGVCREVKEYLEESLKRISGYLTPAAKYSVGIQCPESNFCEVEHLFTEQNLLAEKEISCSCNGRDHVFDTDLSRFWFPQVERESMPNGNRTLEVGDLKISSRKLSRGNQTPVFEGEYERNPVAIKKIPKEIKESKENAQKYNLQLKEIESLRKIFQHGAQNIVRFLHSEEDTACFYFAFELCQATLDDYVEQQYLKDKLSRPDVLQHMTIGLAVLHHQLKIAHRDLKPLNILIRSNGSETWVVISDFGCSKMFGDDETCSVSGNVGSNGWVAPEIYRFREESPPGESIDFTKECDIFSLGCLFFYVASNGKHPFGAAGSNQQTNINVGKPPNFKELPDVLAYMQPLIAKMVSSDPQDRPAASDIKSHPAIMRDNIVMDFFCLASRHIPNRDDLGEVKSVFPDLRKGWLQVLPHTTRTSLETYGTKKGKSGTSFYKTGESKVQPLLRAVRNLEEHFDDLILQVKSELGYSVSERVAFWLKSDRFPNLLQYVYDQLKTNKTFMKDWLEKIHV